MITFQLRSILIIDKTDNEDDGREVCVHMCVCMCVGSLLTTEFLGVNITITA